MPPLDEGTPLFVQIAEQLADDIVDGVLGSGYRSSSANFRGIVNQTLIKEKKKFTSPSRGMYQLKK